MVKKITKIILKNNEKMILDFLKKKSFHEKTFSYVIFINWLLLRID